MNASIERALTASISPQGRLFLEHTDDELVKPIESVLAQQLMDAFDKSTANGLTLLASTLMEKGLNAPLEFWRRFGESYFQALCRNGSQDSMQWVSPQPPSTEELQERIDAAELRWGQTLFTVFASGKSDLVSCTFWCIPSNFQCRSFRARDR